MRGPRRAGDEVPVDHDHGVEIEVDGRIALSELRPQEPAGRRPPVVHPPGLGDGEHAGARCGDLGGRVVETREELTEAVMETARTIARNAPLSVRQAKRSMHFGLQMDLRSALRFEVECYNQLVGTEDRREGIASFNEKRKPVFNGR